MGDANPIRTLEDYSKPSHEGYRNTIELFVGNNVHLKDFLKLVDSLDLDGENRERTRPRLFQFSLRDQASNWLERLLAGSITTWEDLTTRFLAQFFPPGRTAKLRKDILMFQQHQGESLSEAWTRFKDLLQKSLIMASTFGFKNAEESYTSLEDLALYDNESWNDPRYFVKLVKAISLPQDVPSTSDHRFIEFENQVQHLMEAHLAPTQPTQVNKVTTSCEICSGPHDTQYCMKDPKQASIDYASLQTNETGSKHYQIKLEKALIDFDSHQEKRLSSLRTQLEQQQDDMISIINLLWKAVYEKLDDPPIHDIVGNPTTQMNFASTNDPTREELQGKGIKSLSKLLSPKYLSQSSLAKQNRNPSSLKCVHFVNSIVILNKKDETKEEGNVKSITTEYEDHEMTVESEEEFREVTEDEIKEEEEDSPKNFDTFPTMKQLRHHYNWIMSKRLGPRRKPLNPRKICNFVGRVKGLKVFVGNFTYECDFMVLEDTTSVIDHDLGSVMFGKPFVETTGLVYDREEGTITFEKDKEKIMFKMPHKMEMFRHIDFTDIKTDHIPPFAIESDDDSSEKTYYSNSLDLGSEYKHDKNVCRAIRSLIAMKAKRNKGEVT
ncbi:MAK10-like protein [Tanacetum coccineum]